MARKGKKGIKQTTGTASKISKQMQTSSPRWRAKYGRYAIWSISGLLAVVAVVVAWTIFQNISQSSSESTSMNQSQAAVPAANLGTDNNSVSGGPQISFPETSYDFGTIAQGSKVSHTFIVRNVGDAPLRLIKAAGS
jgi:hypothetical protein